MKQTNNAIKFLMAQYRAIFQNAYFKGLATAAVVTMGLAAGQAQAVNTAIDTLTGDKSFDGSTVFTITATATANNDLTSIKITAGDSHSVTGAETNGTTVTANKTNLIIEGTGDASTTKLTVAGVNKTNATAKLIVKDLAVKNGTLELTTATNAATVEAESITVGKEATQSTPVTIADDDPTAVISVGAGSTLGKDATTYQLYEGAQITVEDGSTLKGASLKAAGGKIIYESDDVFTLKSYNENDAEKTAQKLDLDVAAGKTLSVKLAGKATDNRGVLHFASGSTINLASASATKGTLAISGDTTSGSLVILDSGVNLTSTGADVTTGGVITVTGVKATDLGTAELQTDADVLGKFLVGSTEEPKAAKGGVTLAANSKLTINNKNVVLGVDTTALSNEKLDLALHNAAAAGKVAVTDATTIAADNLSVVKNLTGMDSHLSLVADKLTLGSADFDSNTNKFGFKTASAKSELNFVSKTGGNTLKLQDTVTLHNVDSDNKALAGKINGDVNLASTLTIKGGNYTYNDNITIGSSASNTLEVKTEAGVDKASLVLGGSLLVNRANASQVTASGTDSGEAFIDLSNATITFEPKATTTAAITFLADKNATIKVGGESIQELVKDSTKKGAIFSVDNGGTLLVGGDLTLEDTASQLKSASVSNSGIQLANGTVAIDGTLTLKKADSVSLGASDATTTKLKAQVLSLEDKTADTATELNSGTFAVTQTLNTNSNKGFTLGAQGVLELGVLTEVTPKTGDKYFEAVGGGSINQALEVNGASSAVKVLTGNWTGTDLTIKQASGLVVGRKDAKDSKGELISANLTVNKLDVQAESGSTINKGSSLTTTEVALSTGTVVVDGDLSINGKYTAENTKASTPVSYGLAFKDNSVVLNEGASLTLGADVNYALGIAPDATKIDAIKKVDTVFLDDGVVSGGAFSNVAITLGEGVSLTTEAINQLEAALFGKDGTKGTISIGQATIADLPYDEKASTEDTPVLNWTDVKNDKGLMAVLSKVEDEKLKSALIKADQNDTLLGNIGSIKTNGFTGSKVNIGGNGSLNSADVVNGQANKLFAYNDKGEVLGLDIKEGVNFKLVNGGEAGDVSLGANSQLMIDGGASNSKTVLASLSGKTSEKVIVAGDLDVNGKLELNNVESKAGTTLNVAKDATFEGISTLAGDTVVAGKLTAEKAFTSTGELTVTKSAQFKGDVTLSGKNTLATVAFAKEASILGGSTAATEVTLKGGLNINGSGELTADVLKAAGTSVIKVGKAANETAKTEGSNGLLSVGRLDLAGGALVVDPEFNKASSFAGVNQFGSTAVSKDDEAGIVNGKVYALQNAIVSVGTKDEAAVKSVFAKFVEADGSLQDPTVKGNENGVGAIAYVAKKFELADTSKLVVDPSATDRTYTQKTYSGDIFVGSNAALAIDVSALADDTKAAITFNKTNTDATVFAEDKDNSKVFITGSLADVNGQINLFDNTASGKKVLLDGADSLTVQTLNGLYSKTYKRGEDLGVDNIKLDFNKTLAEQQFSVVSEPVKTTLIALGSEYNDYTAKTPADKILGVQAAGYYTNGTNFYTDKGKTQEVASTDPNKDRLVVETIGTEKVAYFKYDNKLLSNILVNGGNAVDAETVARLAVFGGAPQAAIEAGASTYEAISARMGVGVSGVSAAANGQGGAIWVTPVYKSADSDGFNADNKSYGADVKLYGLALGADIEVAPSFKVGGMFNVGSGDADGQGLGSNVSNDFDYYGLGLYAGYSMDAFSLVADVTYTAVDNDIEGNTDLGKVKTSIDSTNLSVGVTGQYKLSLAGMDVTPHAGVRFSKLDIDDYATEYAQSSSDSLNIFSVPVGVTIAKEYVTDTWTVKPSFDLTLTGNFGDDEFEGNAQWATFSNLSTNVKSEIMDNFTYGAAVGVSATTGNFGLGLGVNYTGSSNTDEFGVNANARYMF